MRISLLAHKHSGATIYVCGTGPSFRCMDPTFLNDKITIGLNQFWRNYRPTYSLTVHPELVLEYQKAAELAGLGRGRSLMPWIVKKKAPMGKLTFDDPNYFVFETAQEDLSVLRNRPPDKLYLAHGIQCTALDLAARMGAKNIILVGTDMCS